MQRAIFGARFKIPLLRERSAEVIEGALKPMARRDCDVKGRAAFETVFFVDYRRGTGLMPDAGASAGSYQHFNSGWRRA